MLPQCFESRIGQAAASPCIGYAIPADSIFKVKVKQSHYRPGQALGFQETEDPRFQDNRHMKVVRLSALSTGRLYPQETFLVLIPVRD
jgi:hypothetical protein